MSRPQLEKEQARPPRLQAELFEESGISLGSYVTDGSDRLIIGSSKRADLVVPHSTVSQIHAMLRIVGASDILLYDLGSERGTYVDGKKIIERRMTPGEIFEIGSHRVRVNLLDQLADELGGERAIFWKADCSVSPDRLEVVRLESGIVRDERTILKNCRLFFGQRRNEILIDGTKRGDAFLHRRDSGESHTVEARVPAGYRVEIYNGSNDLIRVVEEAGSVFTFQNKEKVRFLNTDETGEILIFWNEQGARVSRKALDSESPALRKTLGLCITLAAVVLTVVSYVPLKKETVEEAVIPKTSYERLSMDSAPAPAQQAEAPAKAEGAAAKQEQQQAQQVSKAASISSSLSKLLNKKSSLTADTIQQAISQNGNQTTRQANIKNANIKSEAINSGAVGGGAVNVNALSAGLSSGAGAKAGSLNGFANGKGASIGGAGGSGFGGKGFDLNLGGDEAEAIGGLDKSLIAAVVQSNIGQIKHCYERQLIVDPNIYGKIVAQWTITGDGGVSVSSVKKSTMNNKAVENCILAKIKGWTFPKPKGGGQVIVSYPFLFKSLN